MKTRLLGVPSRVSPDLTSSESLRRSTASAGSIRLQPKLSVNQPGDKFEQEADRIAEQVMRMPAPSMQSDGPHRDVGTCREGLQPASRLEPGGRILRTANDSTAGIDAPQIVNSVVASSGMPLPTESRRFMESRFGQDFSQVRVHTDGQGQESADAVAANAYTVGSHIVFGRGQFQPNSSSGQRLLAHELTHTLQQGSGTVQPHGGPSTSSLGSSTLQRDEAKDKAKKTQAEEEDFKKRIKAAENYRPLVTDAFKDYSDTAVKVTESDLIALIAIESSGDPKNVTGSHRGLFQLNRANNYDSQEFAAARKKSFNKTKQDTGFSWDDKGMLDPKTNVRYGTFVVMERGRQANASINRKSEVEKRKQAIENDAKTLADDKVRIPKRIAELAKLKGSEVTEAVKLELAELRKQSGGLSGRQYDINLQKNEVEKALQLEIELEPGNLALKDLMNSHPAAAAYLLHQQGMGGLRKLLANPQKGISTNQRENLPDAEKKTMKTNKEYIDFWIARYEKFRSLVGK